MDPLEMKLKRALEGEEPPAGFAERVVARALDEATGRAAAPRRDAGPWRWWAWLWQPACRMALAGGLAALMLFALGTAYQRRQERLRAEKARAELILALEITNAKLQRVRTLLLPDTRPPQEIHR